MTRGNLIGNVNNAFLSDLGINDLYPSLLSTSSLCMMPFSFFFILHSPYAMKLQCYARRLAQIAKQKGIKRIVKKCALRNQSGVMSCPVETHKSLSQSTSSDSHKS
jgi:hypothetical protein